MALEPKKKSSTKKKTSTAKPKTGSIVTVKTLSGAERWAAAPKRKTKRKTGGRLRGIDASGIFPAILGSALENLKPVAGGIAAEMVVNTIAENFRSPNSKFIGNLIVYLAAGVGEKMVSPKMNAVRGLLSGASVCAGKDAAEHMARKFGVTSLSGYETLAGYTGYTELAGDRYRVQNMSIIPEYSPALSGGAYGTEEILGDISF